MNPVNKTEDANEKRNKIIFVIIFSFEVVLLLLFKQVTNN